MEVKGGKVNHLQADVILARHNTVPAAAIAFLASTDFEDAIRNAVSFGGDTDTLACISGALAEAFYGGVPVSIQREVMLRLDEPLKSEVRCFARRYGIPLEETSGVQRE